MFVRRVCTTLKVERMMEIADREKHSVCCGGAGNLSTFKKKKKLISLSR